ncbi:hypothetical protein E4U43_003135 [Claviceps pusilla]|uniref:Uncharacterized protein n=1 Tax=Claviceps pusilla TaxID=123648 RepID=A0A9P7T364_9HYPO|nr:hypothetical protein E4U43_003135 [Claviceps pusilla]
MAHKGMSYPCRWWYSAQRMGLLIYHRYTISQQSRLSQILGGRIIRDARGFHVWITPSAITSASTLITGFRPSVKSRSSLTTSNAARERKQSLNGQVFTTL